MVSYFPRDGAAAPGGRPMKSAKIIALILAGSLLAACGANMLPSRDPWYAMHYFIMQDYERSAYWALTDNGRLEFQAMPFMMKCRGDSGEPGQNTGIFPCEENPLRTDTSLRTNPLLCRRGRDGDINEIEVGRGRVSCPLRRCTGFDPNRPNRRIY